MHDCGCTSHGGFLTAKGLAEAAQRELEFGAVDAGRVSGYLDRVGSVSGSHPDDTHWDDALIDEQDRRFHNGS